MAPGLLGHGLSAQAVGVAVVARCVTVARASPSFDGARPSGQEHNAEDEGD